MTKSSNVVSTTVQKMLADVEPVMWFVSQSTY